MGPGDGRRSNVGVVDVRQWKSSFRMSRPVTVALVDDTGSPECVQGGVGGREPRQIPGRGSVRGPVWEPQSKWDGVDEVHGSGSGSRQFLLLI